MNERKAYPTDLTDDQWAHIRLLLPRKRGKGGRPKHSRREMLNAILYIVRSGSQWRLLPHDFPPWQSVYGFFRQLGQAGVWESINAVLRTGVRPQDQRDKEPSVVIVDSQSVKTTEKGGHAATTEGSTSKDANGTLPSM
jgi:transposase